jgi:hypothetical protein
LDAAVITQHPEFRKARKARFEEDRKNIFGSETM